MIFIHFFLSKYVTDKINQIDRNKLFLKFAKMGIAKAHFHRATNFSIKFNNI